MPDIAATTVSGPSRPARRVSLSLKAPHPLHWPSSYAAAIIPLAEIVPASRPQHFRFVVSYLRRVVISLPNLRSRFA
jgi:hypothetical protein